MTHPPLFLLRHGQTDWNAERRIQGRKETDLTAFGLEQAARQGEILRALDLPPDLSAHCSPQRRARQTADVALAGLDLDPSFDDRLMEIHVGEWEGRLFADLEARHPGFFESRSRFFAVLDGPGESFDDMSARLGSFLADLSGPALVVSHGVALTFLRGLVLGLARDEMAALKREQGVVYELCDGAETVHR